MSNGSKLIDVADLIMGQSPPSETYNEEGIGLPFYQGKSDFGATYPTPRIFCSAPLRIAEPGDILMSVRAPVGATNLCKERSCIGRGLTAIRPHGVDRDFLYFNLKHIEPYLDSLGSGAIFKAINKHQLSQATVNEVGFDSPEQQRIAQVLSTVQEAIAQQERLIHTTTELKQALMQKLFTEGLRGEALKETEIGRVPESWEVVAFAQAVNIKNGQVDPRVSPYKEMPHVGSEHIESGTGRLVNVESNEALGVSSGNYHFTNEDVLYSKIRPYLNKVALPDFEGTCSADMYPVRSEVLQREFLFYQLLSDRFVKAAMSFQDRTGIPKINRAQLGTIQVVVPSANEQQDIAIALKACDDRMDGAIRKRNALQDLFRTLLHELMTGKVRVGES